MADASQTPGSAPDWGAVLGAMDLVLWRSDVVSRRYTHVVGAAEALLGFPAPSWCEPGFWTRQVHPDDLARVLEARDRECAAGRPHTLEYRMQHRDGRTVWVRDAAHPQVSGRAGLSSLHGTLTDVSDHRRINEELRSSERWFRSLIAGSLDAVTVLSTDGTVRFESPSITPMLGYTPEERLGSSAFDAIHEEDRAVVFEAFARMLADPSQAHRAEFRYRHRDGSWRRLESLARNLIEDPVVRGVVVHSRDITGLRAAEEGQRESESRYREVVEAMPAAVVLLSRDETLVGLNQDAERLLGVPPHVPIAREELARGWQLLGEDGNQIPYSERPGVRALRTGRPVENVQAQLVTAGAAPRWVRIHARPLFREGADEPHAAFVVLEDTTRQRVLETRLAHSERMEAVGRLAGGIAHDFNNLLTAVRGFSEILARSLPQGSPHQEAVEQLRRAGERGAAMTRQLLAFSRRRPVESRAVDLAALVQDLSPMLRQLIGEHLALDLELEGAPFWVHGDPVQLEQILLNLVLNARDAMDAGGCIGVRLSVVESSDDAALVLRPGLWPCVRLEVVDHGSGIPPEALPHVFEPFFTTKVRGEGTGLGLATVYALVKQSGGGLLLTANQPRGTRVEVLLPRCSADAPQSAGRAASAAEAPAGTGERVLVVEDEPIVRDLILSILGSGGYRVTTAASGEEALRMTDAEPFDLLVSDVVMPGISGLELAHHMRERWPGLAVLHVSGHAEDVLRKIGAVSPQQPILAKPFGPGALLEHVRQRLDAHRVADRPA